MMGKKRFADIDLLKAFSIVGVVAIHVAAFNLNKTTAFLSWNYLQFTVVTFVYCSGFVLAKTYKEGFNNTAEILAWLKKRLVRLLIPFYIYIIAHYSLWFLSPKYFSGFGLQKDLYFFFQSISLTGGVDLNWLPLLYVELMFVLVFLTLIKKNLIIYSTFLLIGISSTIFFFFYNFLDFGYRFLMWLPWSLVLFISLKFYLGQNQEKTLSKKYFLLGAFFIMFFLGLFIYLGLTGQSLILRQHKYPPDLYYLSYSLGVSFFFLTFSKLKFFSLEIINKIIFYLSNSSYSLFFIHVIVLDFYFKSFRHSLLSDFWFAQFLLIFSVSIIIDLLVKKLLGFKKPAEIIQINDTPKKEKTLPVKEGFWHTN